MASEAVLAHWLSQGPQAVESQWVLQASVESHPQDGVHRVGNSHVEGAAAVVKEPETAHNSWKETGKVPEFGSNAGVC